MSSVHESLEARRHAVARRYGAAAFRDFFRTEAAGGVLLFVCAAVGFAWANSPLAASYFGLWETPAAVEFGPFGIRKALLLWINDGLMALFFFLVGLEIKREVVAGELAAPRKAALALAAALGGMLVPAALYTAVNAGTAGADGWGIPMATDIAFALGVLALLGRRVPLGLKVFLTALAIVDDLGAVLVIALFYTAEVNTAALVGGAVVYAAMILMNRAGVEKTGPYAVLAVVLWVAVLKSGVHATVAGVLAALTIPTHRLARLEHVLHGPIAFFVVPVFALANAGVALGADGAALVAHPAALGVVLGLVVGKPLGVLAFAWAAVRIGWARLPEGVTWRHLRGVALLTGIGFTMSIFIGTLAFAGAGALLDAAKVGVLAGSLVAGAAGFLMLRRLPVPPPPEPATHDAAAPARSSPA